MRVFMKDTSVLALKGGWASIFGRYVKVCFKFSFCIFGHTRDMSIIYEKAKYVCFIYM